MLSSEPNLAQPSWGPREVLIGVAALAVVGAASVGALRALDFAHGGVGKAPLWAALASTFILQAGLAGAAYRLGPRALDKLRQLFGPVRLGTARLFLWGGATFMGTVGLTILYAVAVSAISEDFLPPPLPAALEGSELRLVVFVLIVIATPMVEETFFRGFVFGGLASRWRVHWAVLASAAVFAVAHVDPRLMAPAFIAGVLYAVVYRRTGSVWPAILAHTAQNAVAFALTT